MDRDTLMRRIREGEVIHREDLSGMDLTGADLSGGLFEEVSLVNARLDGARLEESVLTRCDLGITSATALAMARASDPAPTLTVMLGEMLVVVLL